jgi:hypothetical protein
MPFSFNYTQTKELLKFSIKFSDGWGWSRRTLERENWESMDFQLGEVEVSPEEWILNVNQTVGFWAKVHIDFFGNLYTEMLCLLHTSEEISETLTPVPAVLVFSDSRFQLNFDAFHPSGYMVDWASARGVKGFGFITEKRC